MKRDKKSASSGTKISHRGKTRTSAAANRRADRSKGTASDCGQLEEALRWSEDALRAITNTVQDAIVIIDDVGKISFWNLAAEMMFGYASHEAIGYKLHMLTAPRRYRERYRRGLEAFRADGKGPLIGRAFQAEAQKKGGTEFPVEISFTSTRIKGKWFATGIIRDISARKRAEEEAKTDEKRLRSLVKISQSKTATLQDLLNIALGEVVALSNSVFGYIYYYSEEKKEFVLHAWSKAVMQACTIPNPPTVYQLEKTGIWGEAVRQRRPLIVNDFRAHNPLKKGYPKGHAPLFRYMTIPVINEGRIVAVVGVANKAADYTDADVRQLIQMMDMAWNIAERKQAEEKIRAAHDDMEKLVHERTAELTTVNKQLRNLSIHLQNVREQERTTIAREIHDELGQTLTALKMELSVLRKKLPRDQAPVIARAESMAELVESTIQSVKRISADLRPGILDHLGLTAAIEWQAQEFEKRSGISCDIRCEPEEIILDRDRTTTVFRIFQETLTNVARHARATKVFVQLKASRDIIELRVRDNGKGIAEKKKSHPMSLGLIGIRERVNYWGGSLAIQGTRNKGTTVTARIRLDSRRERDD